MLFKSVSCLLYVIKHKYEKTERLFITVYEISMYALLYRVIHKTCSFVPLFFL